MAVVQDLPKEPMLALIGFLCLNPLGTLKIQTGLLKATVIKIMQTLSFGLFFLL